MIEVFLLKIGAASSDAKNEGNVWPLAPWLQCVTEDGCDRKNHGDPGPRGHEPGRKEQVQQWPGSQGSQNNTGVCKLGLASVFLLTPIRLGLASVGFILIPNKPIFRLGFLFRSPLSPTCTMGSMPWLFDATASHPGSIRQFRSGDPMDEKEPKTNLARLTVVRTAGTDV